jgi:hypothetical protein
VRIALAVLSLLALVSGQGSNLPALDSLPSSASPAMMRSRCEQMSAALTESGRTDSVAAELLRRISAETDTLRRIPPIGTMYLCAHCAALAGAVAGRLAGWVVKPPLASQSWLSEPDLGGTPYGCGIGGALGLVVGVTLTRERCEQLVVHRRRVADLIRQYNMLGQSATWLRPKGQCPVRE